MTFSCELAGEGQAADQGAIVVVDPNAPQGLPPGVPPRTPAPPGAPPAPTSPTTDPNALMQIIAAIMAQGTQEFEAQQQAALGTAVTQLLQQAPNAAGEAASSLPGEAGPPPMPGGNGAGPIDDQAMAGASGY